MMFKSIEYVIFTIVYLYRVSAMIKPYYASFVIVILT